MEPESLEYLDAINTITRVLIREAQDAARRLGVGADDLAHDALLRALRHGLNLQTHSLGEATNFCRQALRWVVQDCRRRRGWPVSLSQFDGADEGASPLELVQDPGPSPDVIVARAELSGKATQLMAQLDDPHRLALQMRLQEPPATYLQIARRLGVSVSKAWHLVREAIDELGKSLDGERPDSSG